MTVADTEHLRDARAETTPWHIWVDHVLTLAGVSWTDMEEAGQRQRLSRWYGDDMPAWIAASSLKRFVAGYKSSSHEDCPKLRALLHRARLRLPLVGGDK